MVRQCVLEPLMEDQRYSDIAMAYRTHIPAPSDDKQILEQQNYWSSAKYLHWMEQVDDEALTPNGNRKID
ncbi:unnamed protein product [Phytomonas sp. EM1]|nr:unnamed protein product [Phytomonas sp. EM1]|eukprot:CCW65871.1 unnamed protein product [Phytomonas sp. isolate EM1]